MTMNVNTGTMRATPFIGLFAVVNNTTGLVADSASQKECEKLSETLSIQVIPCTLAASSVVGCLAKANNKGFVVPRIVDAREVQLLKSKGINVVVLDTPYSIGNWIALNDSFVVHHEKFPAVLVEKICSELNVKPIMVKWHASELVGSSMILTNHGFVVNPTISDEEFAELEKKLGLKGGAGTANYGDSFVGHAVVVNDHGCLAGDLSTSVELVAIDDALQGA